MDEDDIPVMHMTDDEMAANPKRIEALRREGFAVREHGEHHVSNHPPFREEPAQADQAGEEQS